MTFSWRHFATVLCNLLRVTRVDLPFPADLKDFGYPAGLLTIANITGRYHVSIEKQASLARGAKDIHLEMNRKKQRKDCVSEVRLLNSLYHQLPTGTVRLLCGALFCARAVIYQLGCHRRRPAQFFRQSGFALLCYGSVPPFDGPSAFNQYVSQVMHPGLRGLR